MKALVSVVAVIAVLAAVVIYQFSDNGTDETVLAVGHDESGIEPKAKSVKSMAKQPVAIPAIELVRQANAPTGDAYIEEMIMRIKAEFGDTIANARSQVSLKEFRDDLIRNFPGEGAGMFERIVRGAFPNYADEILAIIAMMESYESWLLTVMTDLNHMDLMDQQGMLWDKRIDMFGDKAQEIWDQELSAEEERNAAVMHTVNMLDGAHELPMDERLMLLQQAFEQGYGQSMEGLIYDTTGVMSQVFFRFESVQQDLRELPNEERQEKINDIRRQIGYDESQIAKMAEADQKKESRWSNGYAYMEERNALIAEATDDAMLMDRVTALRQKYFGNEARTIGKEEDELGFFRYERPRVYGWN